MYQIPREVRRLLDEEIGNPKTGKAFIEGYRDAFRERCLNDPWFLFFHVLGYKDIDNSLHRDMVTRWQRRKHRLMTMWQVPRSHLKTSLWTIGFTIWELLHDPNMRILIVSGKYEMAEDILADVRSHFDSNPVFRWLFPEYCLDLAKQKEEYRSQARYCNWTGHRIDLPCGSRINKKEGNIEVLAGESAKPGKHYDLLLYDDLVNEENVATRHYRGKIWTWFLNSYQLRDRPKGEGASRIRVIGTRWHYDDIYGRIEEQEMRYREETGRKKWLLYRRSIVEPALTGGQRILGRDNVVSLWPERYTKQTIEDLKVNVGPFIFAHQFMNDPVSSEDQIFNLEDIQLVSEFEIPQRVVNYAAVDLCEEAEKGGDYFVVTVASFDSDGNMWVRTITRGRILPFEALELIISICELWDVQAIGIEEVGFQKSIKKFYDAEARRQGYHIPWKPMKRAGRTKLSRILGLEPMVASRRFFVDEDCPNLAELINEMTQITLAQMPAHDDILDTLSDIYTIHRQANPRSEIRVANPNALETQFPLEDLLAEELDENLLRTAEFVCDDDWRFTA